MQQQFLPVHWIDGMKINKTHFIAQNNACTYNIAQGISSIVNEYNYGVLPNTLNSGNDTQFVVSIDNQIRIQLKLQKCKALTLGGHIIDFDCNTYVSNGYINLPNPQLNLALSDLNEKESPYFIVLVINPYERTPYGSADVNEIPIRLPFTIPTYQLQLVPTIEVKKNAIGNFHLPLGKLIVKENKISVDEEYIPPCSCISSHAELLRLHAELENFFGKLELLALQIIQKILQKKQQNSLAAIVQRLCEQTIQFTSFSISALSSINIYQPPVYLFTIISSYSRLVKNTLDLYTGSGKEDLINYLTKWCFVSQNELENVLTSLTNHTYNHLDINDIAQRTSDFAKTIANLFLNMAKLEYIGERPDKGIFVKEQIITIEEENLIKKRRSFLAE